MDMLAHALELIQEAQKGGAVLRLAGGLAYSYHARHCPSVVPRRQASDIDLASYSRHRLAVIKLLVRHGYREDAAIATAPALRRTIFASTQSDVHGDIFYDVLPFSHEINLVGRLEASSPTIPLAELMLQKLQIVEIEAKDIADVLTLLYASQVTLDHDSGIDAMRIAHLCARRWGLWRTVTTNIKKIAAQLDEMISDTASSRVVQTRLEHLATAVHSAPKSLRWRCRSVVGERVRWYTLLEEPNAT